MSGMSARVEVRAATIFNRHQDRYLNEQDRERCGIDAGKCDYY